MMRMVDKIAEYVEGPRWLAWVLLLIAAATVVGAVVGAVA